MERRAIIKNIALDKLMDLSNKAMYLQNKNEKLISNMKKLYRESKNDVFDESKFDELIKDFNNLSYDEQSHEQSIAEKYMAGESADIDLESYLDMLNEIEGYEDTIRTHKLLLTREDKINYLREIMKSLR